MNETQVLLNEQESDLLRSLVRQTGKGEREVVWEALRLLTDRLARDRETRLASLRQACGLWKDRDDLPDFRLLRQEMNRPTALMED